MKWFEIANTRVIGGGGGVGRESILAREMQYLFDLANELSGFRGIGYIIRLLPLTVKQGFYFFLTLPNSTFHMYRYVVNSGKVDCIVHSY